MEISEEKDSLKKPFCHINMMGDGNVQVSSLIEQPIRYTVKQEVTSNAASIIFLLF